MSEGTVFIDFKTIENLMADIFMKLGTPKEDAAICANVLITADKRGMDSHGIARMKTIYYDRIKAGLQNPVTKFETVKDGPTTVLVNGNNGMGHVIAKKSMALAIEKAKKYGMGMAAATNSTHYGIAGYYLLMAAEAGMIGITGTNARPSVAPTFGIENMLGTNPLALGAPTDEDFPFILDCATSLSQRGKVEMYARTGKALPAGWVVGRDGKPKTDAKQVLKDLVDGTAALTPLGGIGDETAGYKGYGYCTFVEILSAALQNGKFLKMLSGLENGKKAPILLGHFFIAIDISSFIDVNIFKKVAGGILRQLRASEKAPGNDRIYTAGEKEHLTWLKRKDIGVALGKDTQEEIKKMLEETGLAEKYKFPF